MKSNAQGEISDLSRFSSDFARLRLKSRQIDRSLLASEV